MKFSRDDCELRRPIASGGMATLFVGRAVGLNADVAVKVLHLHLADDPEFTLMFHDEATLAASLIHPNIVRTYGANLEPPTPFIVMELVNGPNLAQIFGQVGLPLPPESALTIFSDVLNGLHAAHELRDSDGKPLGVVHRDVTPHNILVNRQGVSKLSDFGVAQSRARLSSTNPGVVKGKFAYFAPEQLNGLELDRRADVYCCAVGLWEALTGHRPFSAPRLDELVAAIRRGSRPPLAEIAPELPAPLIQSIERALSTNPDERFETAAAFARALNPTETADEHCARQQRLATELAARGCFDTPPASGPWHAPSPPAPSPANREALLATLKQLRELETTD